MSRLIDADALIKTLGVADDCKDCPYQLSTFCVRGKDFVDACEAITDAPTIDAVEVVLCRNCECWYPEEDGEYGHCRKHDFWTPGSWYCADGKRRTE